MRRKQWKKVYKRFHRASLCDCYAIYIYRIRNIISHLLCPGGSARQFARCTILPLPMLPTLWELIQKILSLYRFVRKVEQVESWSLFVVECHCCRQYSSEESRSGTWSKFQKKKMKCFTSFPFSQDIILSNSHSYNACNNAIESAIKRCNADTLSLDLR